MQATILPNPQKGEEVVVILRRHWFAVLNLVIVTIILFSVPVFIWYFIHSFFPEYLQHDIITPVLIIGASIFYLSVWLFSFTDFIDYYLDMWVVTTDRIINIEQQGLFKRTTSELNLSSIQDVTAEIKGPIQTFFHYGNCYVQTAAEKQRFVLKNIPNPERVQESIIHLSEADRLKEQGTKI